MAHILIVDDELHIRFLIRKVLETAHHSVSEAANGLEALSALENPIDSIDLVILDIGMPRMNGIEFLSEMQHRGVTIPIIVLTAHWDRLPLISEYRISGHMFKPFSRPKMLDLINSALKTEPIL